MEIIGREAEKAKLDRILRSREPEFLALYGRRRVGKTFLIRKYLKNQIVFDISGTKDGSKKTQIEHFFGEYLVRTHGSMERDVPTTWSEMFRYLAQYLYQLPPTDGKHVVFLDEMPWMDTPKSDFVSALEFFWNQHGSRLDNLLLIACGSASSWIRKHLVKARGGLYNRVTQRMKLSPFTLAETRTFLQSRGVDLPEYHITDLYMVVGGIPFYLKEVERGRSVTQIIDDLCFAPTGLLRDEFEQLYYALFRNAEFHVRIIEVLAAAPQGMSRADIGRAAKMSEGQLSKVLEELVECDFVSQFPPIYSIKKEAIYTLSDLYSLFYIKFIRPNKGQVKRVWESLSKSATYTAWSGYAFEHICQMHIEQIKAGLGISGVQTRHGSWRFRGNETLPGGQIDMVIERADHVIHLCEAKYTSSPLVVNAVLAEQMHRRKSIFESVSKKHSLVFNLLLTTYPVHENVHYQEAFSHQVHLKHLFAF